MPGPNTSASPRGTRSKSGCHTCRGRKVKCDEARPVCNMCIRLHLTCEYLADDASAVRLHDRRIGAGSIKKRQYTNWRPQRIVAAPTAITPAETASTFASTSTPASTLTPPSISSPCIQPAPPLPASFDSFFHDFFQPDLLPCAPISACSSAPTASTALAMHADFASTFMQDDFAGADFGSYMPSTMDSSFMFLGDMSDMDLYSPGDSDRATTATAVTATSPSATLPPYFPLGLVLGTTTIVLSSFASRARLTERDYEALILFHQHVGFSVGSKSPVWSTHAILIKLAVHHPAILHFLLAASFTEQHWRAGQNTHQYGHYDQHGRWSDRDGFGEAARAHYMVGEAALAELTATAQRDDNPLYHVVIVACFWLEYLIHRRRTRRSILSKSDCISNSNSITTGYRRWATSLDFSGAMGDYVRAYRLRESLMGNTEEDKDGKDDEDDMEDKNGVFIEDSSEKPRQLPLQLQVRAKLPPHKYRSILSRLLSWLYWYDCTACFFGKGGQLANQFQGDGHHAGQQAQRMLQSQTQTQTQSKTQTQRPDKPCKAYKLDPFYETARTTLLDFWEDYTPEEIADDNQNWPALQLINETWVLVHALNRLAASSAPLPSLAAIAHDARELLTRYATVFRLSSFAESSGDGEGGQRSQKGQKGRSRLLAMADWAVCHHLALELHLLRAGGSLRESCCSSGSADTSASTSAASIAAEIIHLAERAIRTVGPVELDRFQWSLFWAGTATDNHVYRYFVLSNLINADFRAALEAVIERPDRATMGLGELRAICRAATM